MNGMELKLFGKPSLLHDGNSLALPPLAFAVLALLARQSDGTASRERLCTMLWADEEPEAARHNLRQILWSARQAGGDDLIAATRQGLSLGQRLVVDVRRFEEELGTRTADESSNSLVNTLELYRGYFLEGLELTTGPDFEDWLLSEREFLHRLYSKIVLAEAQQAGGSAVLSLLERLYRLEPLDENVARRLMELYEKSDQPNLALRVFRSLTRNLDRELGVEPAAALREMASRLRRRSRELALDPEETSSPEARIPAATTVAFQLRSIVCVDFMPTDDSWDSMTELDQVAILAECHHFVESMASRFGAHDSEVSGQQQLSIFDGADAAVQFGLTLMREWQTSAGFSAPSGHRIGLRLAAHVGECAPISQRHGWLGPGVRTVRRLITKTPAHTLTITEGTLDLLPAAKYETEFMGRVALDGDHIRERSVYRVLRMAGTMDPSLSPHRRVQDIFLQAVSQVGAEDGDNEREEAAYLECLELDPRFVEAHSNLAVLLKQRGDLEGAAVHYREALRLRPDYPEGHFNYAALLETVGSLIAATEHYKLALASRPDFADAQMRYANLLKQTGHHEEAKQRYERVIQLRPGYAEAHNNYAILLEDLDDRPAARKHYRLALRRRPDYPEAHYNLALHFEAEANLPEAARHYRLALASNPDLAEAHNNLAALLYHQGRINQAISHYKAALRLRPNDPEVNHNFAIALTAAGNREQAEIHFRIAQEFAEPHLGGNGRARATAPKPDKNGSELDSFVPSKVQLEET